LPFSGFFAESARSLCDLSCPQQGVRKARKSEIFESGDTGGQRRFAFA